ncbi:acetylornithine and succinylornithine aminotransferase [Fomitopsis serialis]|uniref:acetylornithine and succinylornithine aminotransferase n=1 Tax=Fomitopsis serialis TaxID=139415 RepID=UPI0020081182|nr:acetylornithine and succinylornithine aminotransferase [Neoantrodia serialis]KAH9938460.1 acetylornithine and succinylornithine aminotransferase [Neoantrodia serialis]
MLRLCLRTHPALRRRFLSAMHKYTAATHPEDPSSVPRSVKASSTVLLPMSCPSMLGRPLYVAWEGGVHLGHGGSSVPRLQRWYCRNALGHSDMGVANVMASEAGTFTREQCYHNNGQGSSQSSLSSSPSRKAGLAGKPAPRTHPRARPVAEGVFSNSGTEANEGALKVARKLGRRAGRVHGKSWDDPACDKHEIVCFERGFHGRSMGALSVTTNPKYQKPFAPLLPGVKVGRLNVLEDLEKLLSEKTCAVIVEPIQGEGGVHAADVAWLQALRKKCDDVGAVLIYDEIQCGLYRTGSLWAHSTMPINAHPDVVTMAKPLANGYPIGAVLMRDNVAETMTAGSHGTTFGGSPLACALGFHVLSRLSERPFVSNMVETSAYLSGRLAQLPRWFPGMVQPGIRGRGLIVGLGFKDASQPGKVVQMARERGVLLLTAGNDAVRLVPSLNIGRTEVDMAVDVIEGCLHVMQSQ